MYERFFRSVLFPFFERNIKKRDTNLYLFEYNQQQWKSLDELQSIQLEKLKKLLFHAYETVPYYRQVWDEIDFHPKLVMSADDIKHIPALTKTDISNNFDRLLSELHKSNYLSKSTGGSTGAPMHFAYSQESFSRRNAVMWRGYSWAKLLPGKKSIYLWGTSIGEESLRSKIKDSLYNKFYNRTMLSCFEMPDATMNRYVKYLNKSSADVLVSYVNPVYYFAQWVLDNNIRIDTLKSIITGAEPLHEYQREIIEKAFDCDVYNTYGCREVMLIASECEYKEGLHINIDHLVIEAVDNNNQHVLDAPGELLITDLHNYAMPLIRYKNEDIVTLSSKKCNCGRGLPLMSNVQGRVLDVIRTIEGKILPGEFFPHFFKDFHAIEKFQVIQNEITKLDIKIIVKDNFQSHELTEIKKQIKAAVGDKMKLNVSIVEEIPLTPSGKHRVTISNIPV